MHPLLWDWGFDLLIKSSSRTYKTQFVHKRMEICVTWRHPFDQKNLHYWENKNWSAKICRQMMSRCDTDEISHCKTANFCVILQSAQVTSPNMHAKRTNRHRCLRGPKCARIRRDAKSLKKTRWLKIIRKKLGQSASRSAKLRAIPNQTDVKTQPNRPNWFKIQNNKCDKKVQSLRVNTEKTIRAG